MNKLVSVLWILNSGMWMVVDIYNRSIAQGIVWGLLATVMIIERGNDEK